MSTKRGQKEMKTNLTAKKFLEMADSKKISHEKLIQGIMVLYGMGAATTEFEEEEPVMSINPKEFFKFLSELF